MTLLRLVPIRSSATPLRGAAERSCMASASPGQGRSRNHGCPGTDGIANGRRKCDAIRETEERIKNSRKQIPGPFFGGRKNP